MGLPGESLASAFRGHQIRRIRRRSVSMAAWVPRSLARSSSGVLGGKDSNGKVFGPDVASQVPGEIGLESHGLPWRQVREIQTLRLGPVHLAPDVARVVAHLYGDGLPRADDPNPLTVHDDLELSKPTVVPFVAVDRDVIYARGAELPAWPFVAQAR